jgi:hypothetical protein
MRLIILLLLISCTSYNKVPMKSLKIKDENCKEFFSKNNLVLNGNYVVDLGKGFMQKGSFINGIPIKIHKIEKDNKKIKRILYDNEGRLVSYTYYDNIENNIYDDYYNIQKYDSLVTTFDKNSEVDESIYIYKSKKHM